jgi:hypothetical protein
VLAAPGPKPVREAEKVTLIYGVQDLDDRSLQDLVLQRGNAEGPQPPVRLRDLNPARGLRSVAPAMEPSVQASKPLLQVLAVGLPGHPVHPRCGHRAQRPIGLAEPFDRDVVQERGEPCLLVPPCDIAHAVQRTGRALPGSVSGTRFAVRVPLDRPPSLHRLRGRLTDGVVRQLRRYYGAVRLPSLVHLGLAASAFPKRPVPPAGRASEGSPGSRAWRFRACTGSSTARGPRAARDNAARDVAFRFHEQRRHPGLTDFAAQ